VADAIEALVIGRITADEFYVNVLIHVEFRLLDDLVARLKPKQFVAWFMKYFADLPVRDIARILELTEDTVDGLLRRARASLRGNADSTTD
jgi:RNA polymerase sigma factor (sigma-70 family)